MKHLLILIVLCSCVTKKIDVAKCSKPAFVKNDSLKHIRNKNIALKTIRYSSAYVSGFAEGMQDAISFHYNDFKGVHPSVNDQFWNPEISWKNKWKNGDKSQGEKFFGSSSFLVWTADAWHGLKAINRVGTIGASIIIPIGTKKKWTYYAKELAIGYLINRAGFYTSYNLIYK